MVWFSDERIMMTRQLHQVKELLWFVTCSPVIQTRMIKFHSNMNKIMVLAPQKQNFWKVAKLFHKPRRIPVFMLTWRHDFALTTRAFNYLLQHPLGQIARWPASWSDLDSNLNSATWPTIGNGFISSKTTDLTGRQWIEFEFVEDAKTETRAEC